MGRTGERSATEATTSWTLGVVLLTAFALALRAYRIGVQELWGDESISHTMATMPDWIALNASGPNPPLYYLLLRGWVALAGESEAALRGFSAVAGSLAVAACAWAGREILGRRVGLWSAAFVAVAPIHVYYSQEARTYAWLTLALFLVLGSAWRAARVDSPRAWIGFGLAALAAVYSHYFALLALVPVVLLPLLAEERGRSRRRALRLGVALAGVGVGLAPWLLLSFGFSDSTLRRVDWIQAAWEATPPALAIPKSLEVFAIGPERSTLSIFLKQYTGLEYPLWLRGLGLASVFAIAVAAASRWRDGSVGVSRLGARKLWLALCLALPLLALWVVSFWKPLYVVGRYDLVGFPAFALLAGLGLAKLGGGGRTLRPGLFVVLALSLVIGTKLGLYYREAAAPPSVPDREAAALLVDQVATGEAVVIMGEDFDPFLYYLRRQGYACRAGRCRATHASDGPRSFAYVLFPGGSKRLDAEAESALAAQRSVLVVVRPYRYAEDRHWFTEDARRLAQELRRLGFTEGPRNVSDVPTGVLEFVRPR